MIRIIRLWAPVVICAGFIFYLSNIPGLKSNFKFDFILRKMAHVTEYFILTFLLWRAFKGSFNLKDFHLFIYPAFFSMLYAASDEFHQLFIPERHGCMRDVLIDSVGVFGFYILRKVFLVTKNTNY
jgi:VanZ family protein